MSAEHVCDGRNRRSWKALRPDEQTALLDAYGHWLHQLPPTSSTRIKSARLRAWLNQDGIDFVPKCNCWQGLWSR
jgi:hypothetical protein